MLEPENIDDLRRAVQSLTDEAHKLRSVEKRGTSQRAVGLAGGFVVTILIPWMVWLSLTVLSVKDAVVEDLNALRLEMIRADISVAENARIFHRDDQNEHLDQHRREGHQ